MEVFSFLHTELRISKKITKLKVSWYYFFISIHDMFKNVVTPAGQSDIPLKCCQGSRFIVNLCQTSSSCFSACKQKVSLVKV